jgi:microcystin-dependent protein
LGGVSGEERHTLTINEMPNHTHTIPNGSGGAGAGTPGYGGGAYTISATGGNQSHPNIPPTMSARFWRRIN